ncbi:MAG: ATP phosphoribosyltransferase regulatory subunit [Lachnospiraceae bacterium]|nr:ATP phosphoribosyltransferase regulatory subunit [Lachnospiraceae bacterium]
MKKLLIHTPEGFRDLYGGELVRKRALMGHIRDVFSSYRYCGIETPMVEYFDVFGSDVGTTPSSELYKFFDRDGNTLVLRPDFTPSVARAVSMHFSEEDMPYRVSYEGSTFVNSQEYQLLLKEQTQMGVELIGDGSVEADAEILMLTCDALRRAGLTDFLLSVGENNYFKSLAQDSGLGEERIEEVRRLISNKNFFGVDELLEAEETSPRIREAFVHLPQLFGGSEILAEAESYAANEGAALAIERLRAIEQLTRGTGNERYISYDFGLLSKFHYYTGIIFSAYTYGVGEPVAKGGRYDRLVGHFGVDAPAVGVGFSVDHMMNALARLGTRKERDLCDI